MRVSQGAFSAGILAEGMYARSDTEKYGKGLRDAKNLMVRPQGGVMNRAGTERVTGIDTGNLHPQFLIPFEYSTEQTYIIEFGVDAIRFLHRGEYVLDTDASDMPITGMTSAIPAALTFDSAADAAKLSAGDLIFVEDPNGSLKLHEQLVKVVAVTGDQVTFEIVGGDTIDGTDPGWGAVGPGAQVSRVYSETHPYELDEMPAVRYAQDADVMYIVHPEHPPRRLARHGENDWRLTVLDFEPTIGEVSQSSMAISVKKGKDVDNSNLQTYVYAISAVKENTGEEGVAVEFPPVDNDLDYFGSKNTMTWDAVDEAERYNLYREDSGVLGFIGTTTKLEFMDDNITPDTSRGPTIFRNPFDSEGNYPSVVSFYEQRLVLGSTLNDPQLVEMSRAGLLENFATSYPSADDDAVRFRLRAQQVNRITALIPHRSFLIMTSNAEWEISPQGDGTYKRPDKRQISPITYYGSAYIQPLTVGEIMLFVEPSGGSIRDFRLSQADEPPGDLTILCRDLFRNREIVSWAYASAPYHQVWVVFDNGQLVSMTYVPEHDVWAWTRHEIGGADTRVCQVAVVKEGNASVPYFVVQRTVDGRAIRLVERILPREAVEVENAYFLDGGLKLDKANDTNIIEGLLHLRGETVSALVDGDVVESLIVDEYGTVDMGDVSGRQISIGLPYEAYLQTLDIDFSDDSYGSSAGRFKAISEVAIRFERSRGLEAGISLDRMNPLKEWTSQFVNQPIPLATKTEMVTVSGDWVRDGTLFIRQRHPLPMIVNGVAPEWDFGG